ncbi:hypothetical protein B7P43_G01017 [Cryptotermes secundus]|uniref:Uncharacterized protein n=1 Tax=Cryptotermes secundus TaxID=105785 RepID=A0A2J7PGC5_9NEOP|nr:hypothetical protein B7P43_G01017 [Cryptotermes secundus]
MYMGSEALTVVTKKVSVFQDVMSCNLVYIYKQKNSMVLVCKRTIWTERPQLVSKVSANFSGERVSLLLRKNLVAPGIEHGPLDL